MSDHEATELLLDEDGALSLQFEAVLRAVFLRYATDHPLESTLASARIIDSDRRRGEAPEPEREETDEIFKNAKTIERVGLNKFAQDTNGQEMSDDTFAECRDFFDVLDDRLTFKGFLQLYQLQTENDPSETLSDLKSWGYDTETLELIATPGADSDEEEGDASYGKGKQNADKPKESTKAASSSTA